MSESERDRLDEALSSLPREVPPMRDLWPQIQAAIDPAGDGRSGRASWVQKRRSRWPWLGPGWMQLAAGVLLVVASSATTFVLTRPSPQPSAQLAEQTLSARPRPQAVPASFSFGQEQLGADYLRARAELDEMYRRRIGSLPPAARAKVERNLADLRHAAEEISATLAEHPSDPLLQDLLMSTYQSELNLLAEIDQMTVTTAMRTDL